MEDVLIISYLVAYPVFFAIRVIALYSDIQIRLTNQKTRFVAVKEWGEVLFNYQTLLWFYFLTLVL